MTPTATPVTPTATPTAVASPTATATPTVGPPTATPAPVVTATVTPTPGQAVCTASGLNISPSAPVAGAPVTISFRVTNAGLAAGNCAIPVTVNGVVVDTKSGSLAPGAFRDDSLSVTRNAAGTYTVTAGGLTGSFTISGPDVKLVPPLSVVPRTVGPRDAVEASAIVRNDGGAPGPYAYTFRVAGVAEGTASGQLNPKAEEFLSFTASRGAAGTYAVSLDGLSSDFTVIAPVVVTLTRQTTITAATTTAKGADGATLELTGDKVEAKEASEADRARGVLMTFDIPVKLDVGKGLDSFTDATTGIKVEKNRIEIPMRDASGEVQMRLVAETEDIVGTGTGAVAKVKKLSLQTVEKVTDLSKDDSSVGKVTASFTADLKKLPQGAKVEVTPKKTLSSEAKAGFELMAQGDNTTIADVGAAIEVKRENLQNGVDVGEVNLKMCVGAEWVAKMGGVERVKGSRMADDGKREFLQTDYLGKDGQGRDCFNLKSPNGFSVFALMAVVPRVGLFEISQVRVEPNAVLPGQQVRVSMAVTNKGTAAGTFNAVLSVNDVAEGTKVVTLAPGETTNVLFVVVKREPGTYRVRVDGVEQTFVVMVTSTEVKATYSNLQMPRVQVLPGGIVRIMVDVTNSEDQPGKTDVVLKVNGLVEKKESIFLVAREKKTVEFTLTRDAAGDYGVEVSDSTGQVKLVGQFKVVKAAEQAKFAISNLKVEPGSVKSGGTVRVTVQLANEGDVAGSYVVHLKVDGVEVESKEVTVEGRSGVLVTFSVAAGAAGREYRVDVQGDEPEELLSGTFSVAKGASFPVVVLVVLIGLAVLAAGAYLLVARRRQAAA